MEERQRQTIADLFRAGQTPKAIFKVTGFPRSTVYRTVAKLEAGGDASRAIHRRRNDVKRTSRFLAGLKRSILANPRIPLIKLARDRHVSHRTIRRAVNGDLGMRSYVRRRKNLLTDKAKQLRKDRAQLLLNHLKGLKGHVTVFVDEKNFTVDEAANRQNARFIATSSDGVSPVLRSKHPASVMVFGAVAGDGRVMPPHFVPAGLRIGTNEYLTILEDVLIPWMEQHYSLDQVVLVQDSAPAHTAQAVQDLLKRKIPKFVPKEKWPPHSPDLNPCDFWLWGVVEEKANDHHHDSVASLKMAIRRAVASISRDEARRACVRFRRRIEQVKAAEGGHIE